MASSNYCTDCPDREACSQGLDCETVRAANEIPHENLRMDDGSHVDIAPTWTFDRGVAKGFDKHVREQLPWYDLVTDSIAAISRHFIPSDGGLVYDIGASNGNIGRALAEVVLEREATFVGIEPSKEMVETYVGPGSVVHTRAESYDFADFDLAVCMLSLIFVKPEHVGRLLDRLRKHIKPGGALIVVERMLPPDGYASIITSRLTLATKLAQGATPDEILSKELSLAGVQRPLDRSLLGDATEWFRFGDFAGWLIEPSKAHNRRSK